MPETLSGRLSPAHPEVYYQRNDGRKLERWRKTKTCQLVYCSEILRDRSRQVRVSTRTLTEDARRFGLRREVAGARQRLSESQREDERSFSYYPPIDPGVGLIAVTCRDSASSSRAGS